MEMGKSIMQQIEESHSEEFEFGKLTKESLKNFLDILETSANEEYEIREAKQLDILKNLKLLENKSKELNKPIPDDLYVVIYFDRPVGSLFYERYKEWFE